MPDQATFSWSKRPLTRRPLRRLIVKAVAEEYRVGWRDSIVIVATRGPASGRAT